MTIDFADPKYRFEERVKRLIDKGCTKEEAETIVKYVILNKEQEEPDVQTQR